VSIPDVLKLLWKVVVIKNEGASGSSKNGIDHF